MSYNDFQRYLAAKVTVDDRALHPAVWQAIADRLPRAPRVLEVGAGTGTMIDRLRRRGVLTRGTYTAVDSDPANVADLRRRLSADGFTPDGARFRRDRLTVEPVVASAFDAAAIPNVPADLLLAHAFLDLVDLPTGLPLLFNYLQPGGLFYFTLTFDAVTAFEPVIDAALDRQIETLYHADMDARAQRGPEAGHSRSGRQLLSTLRALGVDILAAGPSDWIVWADRDGDYPADEAYFLHYIIATVDRALSGHPALDEAAFKTWIARRHAQIDRGELVYIAHQIDVAGRR